MESIKFAVYEKSIINEANELSYERFIVLKNEYGVVTHFTKLENYTGKFIGRKKNLSVENCSKHELEYICYSLNYIFATYSVSKVCRITADMIFDFFNYYHTTVKPNREFRSQQSIDSCVTAVSNFFGNVAIACESLSAIRIDDIMRKEWVKANRKAEKVKSVYIPVYRKKSLQKVTVPILRDIPLQAMNKLLELSFVHAPEIAFAIICEMTAGLRPSETMNLRQETSPLGPGISITYQGSTPITIELDMSKELLLRSDGVRVGGIKKERIQKVYPPFISLFLQGLHFHKKFLEGKSSEAEYRPMFINCSGKAMTYKTYQQKFQKLVYEHLRPVLLESDDPELHVFAQRLITEKLSPHALRHFFTVSLVLRGEDIAQIQYFRGDKSPESALWYLQNKGALMQAVGQAHEIALTEMLTEGGLCHT